MKIVEGTDHSAAFWYQVPQVEGIGMEVDGLRPLEHRGDGFRALQYLVRRYFPRIGKIAGQTKEWLNFDTGAKFESAVVFRPP
jgi:hypothetical protein